MLTLPRGIQALACCAGACLQSFCPWGFFDRRYWGIFNRRRWGIFNQRKPGNIQPALTVKGPKLPVETINWNEAQGYCEALGLRMPSESEWEYPARSGRTDARYGDVDVIAWNGQW